MTKLDYYKNGNPNCRSCGGRGLVGLSPEDPAYLIGFGGPFLNEVRCPRCFPAKKTPVPRAKLSLADQIVALAELHEIGVLTDEEFKLAKQKLLGSIRPAQRKLQAPRREDKDMGPPDLPEDNDLKFSVGDRVSHPSFGKGVIVNIRGSGESAEAIIEFAKQGTKHLALTWAPLKKIK